MFTIPTTYFDFLLWLSYLGGLTTVAAIWYAKYKLSQWWVK